MSAEIAGPFSDYTLVVDGYSVPCADARENDGGTVTFIMDQRLAWTVPVGAFDDVAHLVATAYALGLGLPCAPRVETSAEDVGGESYARQLEGVPSMMRPRRVNEIVSARPPGEPQ